MLSSEALYKNINIFKLKLTPDRFKVNVKRCYRKAFDIKKLLIDVVYLSD